MATTTSASSVFQFVATGVSNLANAIQSFKSTIILAPYDEALADTSVSIVGTKTLMASGGVVIKADMCKEVANSDVSYQLIMTSDGNKKWVTDNVAPQPRTWQISGYIIALPIEMSAIYGFTTLLQKRRLQKFRQDRSAILFKDTDSVIHQVVIPELEFSPSAEVANGLPVTMKLQEMIVLNTSSQTIEETRTGGLPSDGGANGAASDIGAGSISVSHNTAAFNALFPQFSDQ